MSNSLKTVYALAVKRGAVSSQKEFSRQISGIGEYRFSEATISRAFKKEEKSIVEYYAAILAYLLRYIEKPGVSDPEVVIFKDRLQSRLTDQKPVGGGLFDYISGVWLFAHYGLSTRDRFQTIPFDDVRISLVILFPAASYEYDICMVGPTSEWNGRTNIRDNLGFSTVINMVNGEEMFFIVRFPYNQNRIYKTIWTEGVLLCGARGISHQLNCPIVGARIIMRRLNSLSDDLITLTQFIERREDFRRDIVQYWNKESLQASKKILGPELHNAILFTLEELDRIKTNTQNGIAVVVRS